MTAYQLTRERVRTTNASRIHRFFPKSASRVCSHVKLRDDEAEDSVPSVPVRGVDRVFDTVLSDSEGL